MDPDPAKDPPAALRGLEERLDRATAAAERLIAEAGEHAAARLTAIRPPAAGWQSRPPEPEPGTAGGASGERGGAADIELLSQVMRSLRDLIPAELEQRLADALRELLLAIRALIDWYVERLERRRAEPVHVEDIPIR